MLELGCGSGGVTRRLNDLGAEVTGVDWSPPMLQKAARRAPNACFERAEIASGTARQGPARLRGAALRRRPERQDDIRDRLPLGHIWKERDALQDERSVTPSTAARA